MKVKVNNQKLIVKKEKGGDIPKFENPNGRIVHHWYGDTFESYTEPGKNDKVINGRVVGPGLFGLTQDKGRSKPISRVDRSVTQEEVNEVKSLNANAEHNIPTNTNKRNNGSKNRNIRDTRNKNIKNKKFITLITRNYSPTDLSNMDVKQLQARNDAMTRGWGSYVYNGKTYYFTGEDLNNARNNWKINKGHPDSGASGLLGLSTPEQLTVTTSQQTTTPNYGYGITESNLKTGTNQQYYPEHYTDELLRSRFSKYGLNFDDYKWIQADKLPTGTSPVSQEVKTFNPGKTSLSLSPEMQAKHYAFLEDEAEKRSKLLPFPKSAKHGTKLVSRKK